MKYSNLMDMRIRTWGLTGKTEIGEIVSPSPSSGNRALRDSIFFRQPVASPLQGLNHFTEIQ